MLTPLATIPMTSAMMQRPGKAVMQIAQIKTASQLHGFGQAATYIIVLIGSMRNRKGTGRRRRRRMKRDSECEEMRNLTLPHLKIQLSLTPLT
jgi:hypothetical protein